MMPSTTWLALMVRRAAWRASHLCTTASMFLFVEPEVMSLMEAAGMGHRALPWPSCRLAALAILLSVMTETSAFRAAPGFAKPSGLAARYGAAGLLRGPRPPLHWRSGCRAIRGALRTPLHATRRCQRPFISAFVGHNRHKLASHRATNNVFDKLMADVQ